MNMIRVNGVAIGEDAVAREMQHHPAASREDAANEAATALVIRELLLQRVAEREIAGADDDQRIANLIDSEIRVPEPTQEEIARYYRRNTLQFTSPAIYQAAHIFFPARASNEKAGAEAKAKAEAVLAEVTSDRSRFAELAKTLSAGESARLSRRYAEEFERYCGGGMSDEAPAPLQMAAQETGSPDEGSANR